MLDSYRRELESMLAESSIKYQQSEADRTVASTVESSERRTKEASTSNAKPAAYGNLGAASQKQSEGSSSKNLTSSASSQASKRMSRHAVDVSGTQDRESDEDSRHLGGHVGESSRRESGPAAKAHSGSSSRDRVSEQISKSKGEYFTKDSVQDGRSPTISETGDQHHQSRYDNRPHGSVKVRAHEEEGDEERHAKDYSSNSNTVSSQRTGKSSANLDESRARSKDVSAKYDGDGRLVESHNSSVTNLVAPNSTKEAQNHDREGSNANRQHKSSEIAQEVGSLIDDCLEHIEQTIELMTKKKVYLLNEKRRIEEAIAILEKRIDAFKRGAGTMIDEVDPYEEDFERLERSSAARRAPVDEAI